MKHKPYFFFENRGSQKGGVDIWEIFPKNPVFLACRPLAVSFDQNTCSRSQKAGKIFLDLTPKVQKVIFVNMANYWKNTSLAASLTNTHSLASTMIPFTPR